MKYIQVLLAVSLCMLVSCKSRPTERFLICTELHSPEFSKSLRTMNFANDSLLNLQVKQDSSILYAMARKWDICWDHDVNQPLFIFIYFMNGTEFQKQKVRQYVDVWTRASAFGTDPKGRPGYKIRFQYTTAPEFSDVRVFFDDSGMSDSCVGLDCTNYPKDQRTTRFGWINESQSEEAIRAVVLHEFGHVLGLSHEQQSPAIKIPWDKGVVYDYYENHYQPKWTQEEVDQNIFAQYDARFTNFTSWDSTSIMEYPFPASWTKGHVLSAPWNTVLSKKDSAFIKDQYKYYPCELGVTCCWRGMRRVPCP